MGGKAHTMNEAQPMNCIQAIIAFCLAGHKNKMTHNLSAMQVVKGSILRPAFPGQLPCISANCLAGYISKTNVLRVNI